MLFQYFQVVDKLAEHQGLVVIIQQFVDSLREQGQFGAGRCTLFHDQLRVTADSPQAGDFSQDLQLSMAFLYLR